MKEKTPLSNNEAVCFQMLDFEASNSEVSKSNLWKLLLSQKLRLYYQQLPIT